MDDKKTILRRQRKWAKAVGLFVDDRGYLDSIESNLRAPLSAITRQEFETNGGAEWRRRPNAPPKMQALHSSAVLAVNAFEYWRQADATHLLRGLGIDSGLNSMTFERQFSTGLIGAPPTVDVALELNSDATVAIECKFTEWLVPKRGNKPAFKEKYFENGIECWNRVGLPECQKLATALMRREERFRFLHAAQLLKHALGLATHHPQQFSMRYVFYDIAGRVSNEHREELDRFISRVGRELRFQVITYQELFRQWVAQPGIDPEYLRYLGARYFPGHSPAAITPPSAPA